MEKNNAKPIVGAAAAGASAAAPIQATVPASDVADGASVAAPVQAPFGWDPYEQAPYVAPENPYDTSIIDEEPEVKRVSSPSLVLIPFQSSRVRSSVIRVRLFSFQFSCVRSSVIRLRMLSFQSSCVRSSVIVFCDLILFKIRLIYASNQSHSANLCKCVINLILLIYADDEFLGTN